MALRVLHAVESLEPEAGSVAVSLCGLFDALKAHDVESEVVTLDGGIECIEKVDVVHLHGWGTRLARTVAAEARKASKPYVISPQGALGDGRYDDKSWRERFRGWLTDNRLVRNAAAVTALNELEEHELRTACVHANIIRLPYGIRVSDYEVVAGATRTPQTVQSTARAGACGSEKGTMSARAGACGSEKGTMSARAEARGSEKGTMSARAEARGSGIDPASGGAKAASASVVSIPGGGATPTGTGCGSEEARLLLVLAPIHPVEGFVPLLKALSELGPKADGWNVVIAGRETGDWRKMLEAAVRRKGGADRVTFAEAPDVMTQRAWLARASLLAAPSLKVRCPVSVMQAVAAGVPVLATSCVTPPGLEELIRVCAPTRGDLKMGLRAVFELSDAERTAPAERAREAARNLLDWSALVSQYVRLYRRL